MLTLKEFAIGNFMYDVYLSLLEKHIYHTYYVHILSKNLCGRLRYEPEDICTIRYYAERMPANFNLEIQSEYFGNGRSLSIERSSFEIVDKKLNSSCGFHFRFSDDSRQDSSMTHARIISMLDELKTIS